tara:strand:+ start:77 stop:946 length:870 start_codon:yes stop_codon:yes gene_type:complete
MLDKIIPVKILHFLELIRLKNPIGFMLLMWPCWFGLAILPNNQISLFKWYILFFLGSFLMRSSGCIINDIVDINIDNKISRTKNRPLTSKKITIAEAIILLIVLLALSFLILLQFKYVTIIAGLFSFPLIVLYPFMKRFTYWPQFFLGLIFGWGVILVSYQFYNTLNINFILLYIGCIFWTLGYDTIYAYQDKKEDVINNVKSTAVLFQSKGAVFVKSCYLIFLIIIGLLIWKIQGSYLSLTVITIFIIITYIFLNKWKPESKKSSNFYFKLNNFLGLFCYMYLVIFSL